MDRTTKEEKISKRNKEAQELLAELDTAYESEMKELEKKIASHWVSSKDKSYLKLFQELLTIVTILAKQSIKAELAVEKVRMQLETLDKILQKVTDKVDVDLSSLKTEVENLKNTLKEPMFTRLDQFIQQLKDSVQKRQKAGEEYVE